MKRFQGLSVVATVLTVLGWVAIPIGLFVFIVAQLVDDGTAAQVSAGASMFQGGILLVLGCGAVKVLIAIESNTRRD